MLHNWTTFQPTPVVYQLVLYNFIKRRLHAYGTRHDQLTPHKKQGSTKSIPTLLTKSLSTRSKTNLALAMDAGSLPPVELADWLPWVAWEFACVSVGIVGDLCLPAACEYVDTNTPGEGERCTLLAWEEL